MGKAYKLQCKHCATQFIHSLDASYGVTPTCVGCGEEPRLQSVIRCPGCQSRINSSTEEFYSQIIEETFWD